MRFLFIASGVGPLIGRGPSPPAEQRTYLDFLIVHKIVIPSHPREPSLTCNAISNNFGERFMVDWLILDYTEKDGGLMLINIDITLALFSAFRHR